MLPVVKPSRRFETKSSEEEREGVEEAPSPSLDSITILGVSGQTVARKMEKKQMANLPSINGRESRENGGKFT